MILSVIMRTRYARINYNHKTLPNSPGPTSSTGCRYPPHPPSFHQSDPSDEPAYPSSPTQPASSPEAASSCSWLPRSSYLVSAYHPFHKDTCSACWISMSPPSTPSSSIHQTTQSEQLRPPKRSFRSIDWNWNFRSDCKTLMRSEKAVFF